MAKLTEENKSLLQSLLAAPDPTIECIFFGLDFNEANFAKRMEGMAGLIDWSLHGQVSRLIKDGKIESDDFSLLRGPGAKHFPNFLCYAYQKPSTKEALEKLKNLNFKKIVCASSTFPEDFVEKLSQNISKEGVSFTKLEA